MERGNGVPKIENCSYSLRFPRWNRNDFGAWPRTCNRYGAVNLLAMQHKMAILLLAIGAVPAVAAGGDDTRQKEPAAGVRASVPDEYLIGPGDILQISVFKEPDVSVPSVVVRPDGKITVPLVKDVDVGGLTPRQVEKVITEGLSKYIADANVTVVLATNNSKKVFVIGAVKKEGTLPYTAGMTVMQALSESGGLNEYAKKKKLYILRTEGGREYRLDFNYEEVVRGERMEQNVGLLPGDTVVVPH
jgi:polysaccharide export outer membrane protein